MCVFTEGPPNVINADPDRQPVGPLVDHVLLPARIKIPCSIPTHTFVYDLQPKIRVARSEQVMHLPHVSIAERRGSTSAVAVGDAVADEHYLLTGLEH